jgi:hypothetical protein
MTAPATQPQLALITKLIDERDLYVSEKWFDVVNSMDRAELDQALEGLKEHAARELDKTAASRWIGRLLTLPRKDVPACQPELVTDTTAVPAGKYALDRQGEAVFVQVDRPQSGRWRGFVFVSELSGENRVPIHDRAERTQLLEQIAADVEGASRKYGHYRRRCGFCNLKLTDGFSRYFGVGPKCRKKHHMPISRAAFLRDRPELKSDLLRWEAEDASTHTPHES